MTRGWFDLFRDNGGPALYPESNRTSGLFTVYQLILTLLIYVKSTVCLSNIFSCWRCSSNHGLYRFCYSFGGIFGGYARNPGTGLFTFCQPFVFHSFYIYIIWLKLFIYEPIFFSEIHYIYKCGSEFVCWREHIRYIL